MKRVLLKKDTGKRLLVDTIREPDYKDLYLQEDGTPFLEKPEVPEVPEGMVEVTEEIMEQMIEDYQCGKCDKKYKTLKGVQKHIIKCK